MHLMKYMLVTVQFAIKYNQGFPVALVVKNLPANEGDTRDVGSISGLGTLD